jgi:hypothetical protein
VLLKYALSAFRSGGIYQLPHRSFATSGSCNVSATEQTNSASSEMERKRLVMERVDRLSEARVWLRLPDKTGKMISDVLMGLDMFGMRLLKRVEVDW